MISDNQIDGPRLAFKRTADHGPRQQILRIGGHKCQPAGGRNQGHGHRHVVHPIIPFDVEPGTAQISSTYGHEGGAGASVYVGSKHAVEGMTKSAGLEAASSGVRINAVAPGPIETGMLNRFTGTAERKAALLKTVPLG